jgi:hypothetical protein
MWQRIGGEAKPTVIWHNNTHRKRGFLVDTFRKEISQADPLL